MAKHIHFGSFDDRFCGTKEQGREFTLDPNRVTCPQCQDRDTFTLSLEAANYVSEMVECQDCNGVHHPTTRCAGVR